MLIFLFGCDKNNMPDNPLTPDADVSQESLLGTWHVTTINDKTPAAFIKDLLIADSPNAVPGELDIPVPAAPNGIMFTVILDTYDVTVDTYNFKFTADNTWRVSIIYDTALRPRLPMIPDVVAEADPGQDGQDPPPDQNKFIVPDVIAIDTDYDTVKAIGTWSGTYSITDGVLSLVVAAKDLQFTTYLEETVVEMPADLRDAEQKNLLDAFDTHFFKPFAKTAVVVNEEALALIAPGSDGTVNIMLNKSAK